MKKFDTSLYFITDSTGFSEEEFLRRIEAALRGSVTLLQLREKDKTTRKYLDLARKVHALTKRYSVPLIIDVPAPLPVVRSATALWLKRLCCP